MGMYDGLGFETDDFSANHISRETQTPELLIVNVKGKSLSLLAEISGYLNFAENQVQGVILNNCAKGMYPVYRKMIEEKLNLKVYGFLPQLKEAEIGSRHLGLVTAQGLSLIHVCHSVRDGDQSHQRIRREYRRGTGHHEDHGRHHFR